MNHYLKLLIISLFIFSCNNENSKKIYKQFDTVDISEIKSTNGQVSAFEGGEGFEDIAWVYGWETNDDVVSNGSPNAIKGDTLTMVGGSVFPPTLRGFGKESRSQLLAFIEQNTYESLLIKNPETNKYEPELATHWKIGTDSMTFFFRIDPRARWEDGKEVTSEDVIATYKILIDEGHGDANTYTYYKDLFYVPEAISKYIVSIKAKKVDWRTFGATLFSIYPAHYLNKIDGAAYIEKYQFEMMPGTGPYEVDVSQTTQENNGIIVLKRRKDYWAINHDRNIGINNFDFIRFLFINDENQEIERFFNGDFDIFGIGRAQWWRERFIESEYEDIKRGLIQRSKIITNLPVGPGGLAFNSRAWPFDDINVRKAFCHLWDVESLNKKLFFSEYYRKNSLFAFSKYEHPDNPKQDYNPDLALKLLNESGWKKEDGGKWLYKDGKKFEIDMYIYNGGDRVYNPLVADLESVGIKLNLVVIQNAFDKFIKKTYTIHQGGWTGSSEPSPEGMLHSKYADQIDVTNATGMANSEIDKLIEKYNKNWDASERVAILQSIDSLATREYHWAFGWAGLYGHRGLHWNKFGMPEHGLGYGHATYKKYWGSWASMALLWWSDSAKKKELEEAKNDQSITLPINEEVIDYWELISK